MANTSMCAACGGHELILYTSERCVRSYSVLISTLCFCSWQIHLQQTLPCDPGLPLIPKLQLPGFPFLHTPNPPISSCNALHQSFLPPPVYQWEHHTLPSKSPKTQGFHIVVGSGRNFHKEITKAI